jgi:hypothetical protein
MALTSSGKANHNGQQRRLTVQMQFDLPPDDPEIKKASSFVIESNASYPRLPSRLQYFSSWHRAKTAVAWCLHYLQRLKKRKAKLEENADDLVNQQHTSKQSLTAEEMEQAEILIIKAVEVGTFKKEIEMLTSTRAE